MPSVTMSELPTERFSNRAVDYARYRPSYPAAAIDAMLADLAAPDTLVVADVGAGTGISSRLLADRGARVFAVEPNAAMRGAAAPHARVTWVDGTSDATNLPANAHDLVTVAQAFHWFDVPRTLVEFHRILRPGSRLAVFWNHRSRGDAFTNGYRRALEAIDAEAPSERSTFAPATLLSTGHFANLRSLTFDNVHTLSEQELIGRALSTSTVPREGPRADKLLGMLRTLHAEHRGDDGRATMHYTTDVHLCERVDTRAR